MPILHSPESGYVKEMAKWEQRPSEWTVGGLRPGRPFVHCEYPKMLYMARQTPSGKWATSMEQPSRFAFPDDNSWERACDAALKFGESCQFVVNDESEEKRAAEEGWRPSMAAAMEWRDSLEKAVSTAAAERNFRDRNISEQARAEVATVEAEHFGHLAEIPEKPRLRRKAK